MASSGPARPTPASSPRGRAGTSRSGGKAPALARAIHGRTRVARTLMAWVRAGRRLAGVELRRADVNGHPGLVLVDPQGRPVAVWVLDVAEGPSRA